MGRQKKAAAAPEPAANPPGDHEDDLFDPDQDLQNNLTNFLAAAATATKAKPSAAAAAAGAVPASKAPANAGAGAQPGLLPLKRISPASGGQRGVAAGSAADAGGSRAARPAGRAAGSAAAAAAGASGTKRKADTTLPAPGARKQARAAGGAAAADPPIPTDRNGVPSLEGLRSWASSRVSALQERANSEFGQLCAKVIEDGYARVNELAAQHHSTVSTMLQDSVNALEMARSQHTTAMEDIAVVLKDGLLGEIEAMKADLLGALRSEVLGPLDSGIAAVQAKYKIG
ncbi:hypothetical protein PLESTB_001857000 [Pleodorina starrii]|uniref:Uncharacterized protein n=1 Tax=Pleodorina starrii TaxID=330485 RepID=A0A9W6C1Y9_9CHLO|nr:hypothetical protein PLESTM_000590800 [Pleodorina starrii]GLC62223.1 hypothetical protein PLESTB_001857000 [Pleodorina starrii]GLC74028.1 hypothetical protein PLESTF_001451800 [Pleodorina starrii]